MPRYSERSGEGLRSGAVRQKQVPKQNRPAGSRLSKTDERQRSFVVRSGKHRGASALTSQRT